LVDTGEQLFRFELSTAQFTEVEQGQSFKRLVFSEMAGFAFAPLALKAPARIPI